MSDSTSLVSVLIPVYNASAYLKQCLDSVVNQSYSHLQIVIIDDGSTDDSFVLCQEYANSDSRIELYHQVNQGVAFTRNNLLDKVKGEYVLFVDSDDWIELNMVEFLVKNAQNNRADILSCGCVPAGGVSVDMSVTKETWNKEKVVKEFLRHVIISGALWNKLMRTSIIKDIRFDIRVSYGEDALFCWRILQRVDRVIITDAQLYNHRVIEGSLSTSLWTPHKKGSSSIVWQTIVEETFQLWPQYADIARARYAIEDMWGLYYAALANYPYDKHIKNRQMNIRKNLGYIRKFRLVSANKILTAYALAYCYHLGKFLKFIK